MCIELPPLPKSVFDRTVKMCLVTVEDMTFPFSVTLPLSKDYYKEEERSYPKVDLWDFQTKLRELQLIQMDDFVCAVQDGLSFKERHKGANTRPDEAAATVYNWS